MGMGWAKMGSGEGEGELKEIGTLKENEKGKCNDIFQLKWDPENLTAASAELCPAGRFIDVSVKKQLDWRNPRLWYYVFLILWGIAFNVQEETW